MMSHHHSLLTMVYNIMVVFFSHRTRSLLLPRRKQGSWDSVLGHSVENQADDVETFLL